MTLQFLLFVIAVLLFLIFWELSKINTHLKKEVSDRQEIRTVTGRVCSEHLYGLYGMVHRLTTIMGTVQEDGDKLRFVTDQRAWNVDNPEILRGHEGHYLHVRDKQRNHR